MPRRPVPLYLALVSPPSQRAGVSAESWELACLSHHDFSSTQNLPATASAYKDRSMTTLKPNRRKVDIARKQARAEYRREILNFIGGCVMLTLCMIALAIFWCLTP